MSRIRRMFCKSVVLTAHPVVEEAILPDKFDVLRVAARGKEGGDVRVRLPPVVPEVVGGDEVRPIS